MVKRCLSAGMSNSYEVAVEEGANMVRIGSKLFGPRMGSIFGGMLLSRRKVAGLICEKLGVS